MCGRAGGRISGNFTTWLMRTFYPQKRERNARDSQTAAPTIRWTPPGHPYVAPEWFSRGGPAEGSAPASPSRATPSVAGHHEDPIVFVGLIDGVAAGPADVAGLDEAGGPAIGPSLALDEIALPTVGDMRGSHVRAA